MKYLVKLSAFSLFISTLFLFSSCKNQGRYIFNEGQIYGTSYHISYKSPEGKDYHAEIEDLLGELNMIFSTFDSGSVISKINSNQPVEPSHYFLICFRRSMEISKLTGGAFDITVAPLVNAWGFGFTHKEKITQPLIDSLLRVTGYQKVKLEGNKVIKDDPKIMLDMSAISKGYTCDILGNFLAEKNCSHYMVEIGGEVVARGVNQKGKVWRIGINKPEENIFNSAGELEAIVELSGKALATSGNYRNFYVEDGKKYAHTINPKTGYPVQHNLLSATVLASDCMTADALATAFMVMGVDKSIELSKELPGVEVCFIYSNEKGIENIYMSDNFGPVE